MVRGTTLNWRVYALVFALALGLRLGWEALVWAGPLGNADSAAYEDLATKILHSEPYQTNQSAGPGGFPSDLQRPPGYPTFLAALAFPAERGSGSSRHRITLAQCIIGAVFTLLLVWLVASLTSPLVGLIAGCFYACDWATIVYTPMVIAETVYSVVLGAAIVIFALALSRNRDSLALLAGLLLGCAALVKPAGQLILVAFLIGWTCRKRRRWAGLLFLVTYLVCVLPWMIRNELKYGILTLSQIGTANFYFYTAEGALHSYPMNDFAGNQITADIDRLDLGWRTQALSASDRARRMRHESVELIVSHWPTVLRQATIGLVRTSLGTASVTAKDSMNARPGRATRVLLNVLPLLQICFLWAMVIYGCLTSQVLSRQVQILLIVSVFCILVPAAAPLAQSRFRVPATPTLCVLAAAGVARLQGRCADRP